MHNWFRLAQMDVDKLLTQLNGLSFDVAKSVEPSILAELTRKAKAVFQAQPVLLELVPPLVICGDIHAQYNDLRRIFSQLGQPPTTRYIFLGDYVDRGPQNLETIVLLLCYKVKYPACFYLVRGNHETSPVNAIYGFKSELEQRYGQRDNIGLFWMFNDASDSLYARGLSPALTERDQLRLIKRGWQDPQGVNIAMDLLWSDPEPGTKGWKSSPRGCSYLFGDDILSDACRKLDVDVIVRAHQVVQDGYEIHPTQKLVTVFSAPNYCGEARNDFNFNLIFNNFSLIMLALLCTWM
uniref:Serine/threonine-protein phosphatase n=1 Tax=Meloidogyne enterolobii TaxID=390850 RepID=A0A6V7WMM4_MELEN|nr:unnamed protein product [Meloidogyne enterolobii]